MNLASLIAIRTRKSGQSYCHLDKINPASPIATRDKINPISLIATGIR